MHFTKHLLACVALSADPLVEATEATTSTSTVTIFLPPHVTGSATDIYASIITIESSKTEYLLACQTAFTSPYSCDGDFKGVTLTYVPSSTIDIAFGESTYNCTLDSSAVCATKMASTNEGTATLDASQSSNWMTAITVLDVATKKATNKVASTKTAASNNPGTFGRSARSESGTDSSSSGLSGSISECRDSTCGPGDSAKKKSAEITLDYGILSLIGVVLGFLIGP